MLSPPRPKVLCTWPWDHFNCYGELSKSSVIPNSPSCTREKTEGKPVKEERTRSARNRAANHHALELCKKSLPCKVQELDLCTIQVSRTMTSFLHGFIGVWSVQVWSIGTRIFSAVTAPVMTRKRMAWSVFPLYNELYTCLLIQNVDCICWIPSSSSNRCNGRIE